MYIYILLLVGPEKRPHTTEELKKKKTYDEELASVLLPWK